MCQAHDNSFQAKSELSYKSQANEYLTICDIASANRKMKLVIDNFKGPPGKKHKVSHVTYTAEKRASIGEGILLNMDQWLHLSTLQKNLVACYPRYLHVALRKNI